MSRWFPRPRSFADLEGIRVGEARGALGVTWEETRARLFELLTSPAAREWKHKVGVMTPSDGSAKTTTRLLASEGWVFKTDTLAASADREKPRSACEDLLDLGERVRIWHPDRFFFLLRSEGSWWPVSACRELTTLRRLRSAEDRLQSYLALLTKGIAVSVDYGVGLDLNPSNFAVGLGDETWTDGRTLYYVDDESYGQHSLTDLADAVVARITDETEVSPDRWRAWGKEVQGLFERVCSRGTDWLGVVDGMRSFGFPAKQGVERQALIAGFCEGNVYLDARAFKKSRRPASHLTCIFSDVHANLVALETVLRAARELGVDDYLFLGDVVGYGPAPRECVARLAELEPAIKLLGNHDQSCGSAIAEEGASRVSRELDAWTSERLSAEDRQWLLDLDLEHREGDWLAVHGAPQDVRRIYGYVYELTYADNLQHLEEHDIKVCFYGHTHIPLLHRREADGTNKRMYPSPVSLFDDGYRLLLNPGSVGQPRDGDPRAAFSIWHRKENVVTFHRVEYAVEETIRAIRREGLPEDLIFRLELGR